MGNKRELYLHIGVHRTATTAIQAIMKKNWTLLRDAGILYPLGVQRHIGVFNNIFSGRTTARKVALDLVKRADSQTVPIHALVMSDEAVSTRQDLSPLAGFAEHFHVKVIFAMRRQDLWLESWWAQNVKGQWDPKFCHMSWPDFLARRKDFHWIDYAGYIARIEEVFGAGSVVPYVFERRQMPDGPIAAFCRQFGFDGWNALEPAGGENISLCPDMSEFVRHLPFIDAPMGLRLKLIEFAEAVNKDIRRGQTSNLLIPHDLRADIMAEYGPGNQAIARRFFGRDDLFLDPLPATSEAVAVPSLPADPAVLMEKMVAPYMRELVRHFAQPKDK
ncbi:hypothetical protein [Falsirhodobacter halotolerans]|uniref:hypothetical protein n=1 Tax=Falsirhodobacter halotolerans TaxID=1146892 RepID=UPI001FD36CA0|nr:hypothetical protein [Falsirhodobacter halotolerans]MCJ8138310.1 hypothetical protein [Falsirhodobacter halotolerans]